MAVGSDIYVGRGRLRRRFRKQRAETRVKREERRWKAREERRVSRTLHEQSHDVRHNGRGHRDRVDNNNNGETTPNSDRHSCKFCDSFDSGDDDSLYSYSSSDSELLPLIEPDQLLNDLKMPFKFPFKKKTEPKPEPIPVVDPEPIPQTEEIVVDPDPSVTPVLDTENTDQQEEKPSEENTSRVNTTGSDLEESEAVTTEVEDKSKEPENPEKDVKPTEDGNPFAEEENLPEEALTNTNDGVQEQVEMEEKIGTVNGKYTAFADDQEGRATPFGVLCCSIM